MNTSLSCSTLAIDDLWVPGCWPKSPSSFRHSAYQPVAEMRRLHSPPDGPSCLRQRKTEKEKSQLTASPLKQKQDDKCSSSDTDRTLDISSISALTPSTSLDMFRFDSDSSSSLVRRRKCRASPSSHAHNDQTDFRFPCTVPSFPDDSAFGGPLRSQSRLTEAASASLQEGRAQRDAKPPADANEAVRNGRLPSLAYSTSSGNPHTRSQPATSSRLESEHDIGSRPFMDCGNDRAASAAPVYQSDAPELEHTCERVDLKTVNMEVLESMRKSSKKKTFKVGKSVQKRGRLYMIVYPDRPETLKIGMTDRCLEDRMKEQRKCGLQEVVLDTKDRPFVYFCLVDSLLKILFRNVRHEYLCRCGTTHKERYKLGTDVALDILELWRTWAASKPYDEEGELKPYWMQKVVAAEQNVGFVDWTLLLQPQTRFDRVCTVLWDACVFLCKASSLLYNGCACLTKALWEFWTHEPRSSRCKLLFAGDPLQLLVVFFGVWIVTYTSMFSLVP